MYCVTLKKEMQTANPLVLMYLNVTLAQLGLSMLLLLLPVLSV